MKAIVSGRAGIAFLFKGEDAFYIRYPGGAAVPCHMEDFSFLFGDARDLQFLEDAAVSDAEALLRGEVAKAQALQIILILLDGTDGGYPAQVRSSAAADLEKSLTDVEVEEYLSRVLFAQPLSQDGDLDGAFAYVPLTLLRLRTLLVDLCLHQTYIASVCRAWEAIPTATFGSLRERALAKARIVLSGGFRDLARAWASGSEIDSSLPQNWPHDLSSLLGAWISALRLDLENDARWPAVLEDSEGLEAAKPRHISFVAENFGDREGPQDLDVEISKASAQLRSFLEQAGRPGMAFAISRSFQMQRTLQKRQAEIVRPQLSFDLPPGAWALLRKAKELVHG